MAKQDIKLIQITRGEYYLYGLDAAGQVWRCTPDGWHRVKMEEA